MACTHKDSPEDIARADVYYATATARAFAIVLPGPRKTRRLFCKYSGKNKVQTAWHLAGAKLFMDTDATLIVADLEKRGKKPVLVEVIAAV